MGDQENTSSERAGHRLWAVVGGNAVRTGLMECWSNGVMGRFRIPVGLLLVASLGLGIGSLPAEAQDVRAKAEAEGKLMMYATFTAADSKTLVDAFKQLYPKIDAAYLRSTDSGLMERFLTENRAGQNLCDVMLTTSFYGHNIKKRGRLTIRLSANISATVTRI